MYKRQLSMSCHATPLTEGLKDLFGILVRHIMPLCEMQWRTQVKLDVPHYFFFTKMLEHAGVTDEYLHSQMELAGLEDDMEFKLIVMDVDGETESERAAAAIRAARHSNQGNVSCFPDQEVYKRQQLRRPVVQILLDLLHGHARIGEKPDDVEEVELPQRIVAVPVLPDLLGFEQADLVVVDEQLPACLLYTSRCV